jgi:hypothetical protein
VITASSAMEYAFEGDQLADTRELSPSVFTSALVEGLETGEADRDQDGQVALDELYDYVYDKVRAATPNQTPCKWTFGVQGDLYIARRARPVTTPAPLPAELQQAIDNPFADVRAGAVQQLARLLQGRHAGLALAARLALERLTEDDSRRVSAAATAALDAQTQPVASPQPASSPQPGRPKPAPPRLVLSATVIDFGQLPQHSRSPERRVKLGTAGGGILNARVATQASWLKLRQVGDELVIGVDTAAVGEHESVVTIQSDGGSGSIHVLARIDPPVSPHADVASATTPGQGIPDSIPARTPDSQKEASILGSSASPGSMQPERTVDTPAPTSGVRDAYATKQQEEQAGADLPVNESTATRIVLLLAVSLLIIGIIGKISILWTAGMLLLLISVILWARGLWVRRHGRRH